MQARAPASTERTCDTFPVQRLDDCFWRHAGHEVTEDPSDNCRLFRIDLPLASRHGSGVQCLDDAIAVAEATGRLAVLDATAESAVCLLGQVLEEQGVHRTLESDVQVRDVALGERDDVHSGEREPLEEARGVFLVAAEAVERLGKHDVEPAVQRIAHQRLESRAQQRGAGHRVVRVLLADRPALPLCKRAAHAQLIGDRRVPLVVRGIARVDGDFHVLHLIGSFAAAASVPARSARVRTDVPGRERAHEATRPRRSRCAHCLSREREARTPAAPRPWSSSLGHDTPAHSERRCRCCLR